VFNPVVVRQVASAVEKAFLKNNPERNRSKGKMAHPARIREIPKFVVQ
jgi:hypothetical protein